MRGSPLTFLQRDEPVSLDWIPEPLVQFRHGQCVEDPRDGRLGSVRWSRRP